MKLEDLKLRLKKINKSPFCSTKLTLELPKDTIIDFNNLMLVSK